MKAVIISVVVLSLLSYCSAQVYDDFEDGNANNWVVTEGVWAINSPGAEGSNYCYGSNSLTSETYYLVSERYFELEIDFWIDSEFYGNFDIEFNYQNSNYYYMVDLADPDSDDPNARLYRYIGGVETILDETPNILSAGIWEHLRIQRSPDNQIQVFLPDYQSTPLLSATDNSLTGYSEVRFRFYAGGDIDNFLLSGPSEVDINPFMAIPDEFVLHSVYPNPFNPIATIPFELKSPGNISLTVYDMLGREVANLHQGWLQAGNYQARFNGGVSPSGIYFVKLQAGDFQQTRKMVLLK
jgi:hypothetical protein